MSGRLSEKLARMPTPFFVVYAVVSAFGAYFCMYAFRKPFAAAQFEGETFAGGELELKSAIVISQVLGYAVSKYVGIKVCSELPSRHHPIALVALIIWAEGALWAYAETPGSYKVLAIFLNGLSLGMVWGLVVRFLEGRVTSELLLAGLSSSFIVSSGIVKDLGRAFMSGGVASWWANVPFVGPWVAERMGEVSESWMPMLTGLHFLPFFILFVWMLAQLPQRTEVDHEQRHLRESMDGGRRLHFLMTYLPGMVLLFLAYLLLTAYRDYRDNFAVELFSELGYPYEGNESIITQAEISVAVGVLVTLALLNALRRSRAGLIATFVVMGSGTAMLALSTLAMDAGWISGFVWMTLIGFGSYLAYVPYGSMLFERLMASSAIVGTAVFGIYMADAVGYTGSVAMLLFKDLVASEMTRLDFFKALTYVMAIVGTICLAASCFYFVGRSKEEESKASAS